MPRGGQILDAAVQLLQRDAEIDDPSQFLQIQRAFFPAYRASPWGNDRVLTLEGENSFLLRVQKSLGPLSIQDLLKKGALPPLDDQIYIDKAQPQGLGQQNPHSAFARTRHTDEYEVVQKDSAFPYYNMLQYAKGIGTIPGRGRRTTKWSDSGPAPKNSIVPYALRIYYTIPFLEKKGGTGRKGNGGPC